MSKYRNLLGLTALGATVSLPAFAAGVDYSTLTSAVDFASVITGILAVAAVFIGVLVVLKGVKWVKAQVH